MPVEGMESVAELEEEDGSTKVTLSNIRKIKWYDATMRYELNKDDATNDIKFVKASMKSGLLTPEKGKEALQKAVEIMEQVQAWRTKAIKYDMQTKCYIERKVRTPRLFPSPLPSSHACHAPHQQTVRGPSDRAVTHTRLCAEAQGSQRPHHLPPEHDD